MDENELDIAAISHMDDISTSMVSEQYDVDINTNNVYYHLSDHDYFDTRIPTKKPTKKQPRSIKITELRAVYNCKSCGYRTMKREVFSKHKCPHKTVKMYIPCTSCDKSKAPEGYEKCPKCSYFTKHKSSLKVHMRIHSNGTPYKCTECEFSGKDLKELIRHYEDTKDLVCDCGYGTHIKQQMLTHKRSHTGEKPFSCGICSYSTADRAGLHRHMRKHSG